MTKGARLHRGNAHVTVDDLWQQWHHSEVYNWSCSEVVQWLVHTVHLPQYEEAFTAAGINGTTLPRYTYSMCVSVPVCLALCAYICTVCWYVRVYIQVCVCLCTYICIFLFNVLIGICSLCYASCSTFTSFVIMNRLSGEGGRGDKVQLSPSIIHPVFPLLLPLPLCLSQSGNEH